MGMNQSMGMGNNGYGNNSMMGGGGGMNTSMQQQQMMMQQQQRMGGNNMMMGNNMQQQGMMGGNNMQGMGGMGNNMGMGGQWAGMTPQQQQMMMMQQQQGLCGCCQNGQQQCCQNGQGCCQPPMNGNVDLFICGNESAPLSNALNPLESTCDCATMATFLFAILSIVGFGISVGLKGPDAIFDIYNGTAPVNTAELQERMINDIPYLLHLRQLSRDRTDNLTRRYIHVPITTTAASTTTTTVVTTTPTTTSQNVTATTSTATTTAPFSPIMEDPNGQVEAPPAVVHGVDYTYRHRQYFAGAAEEGEYNVTVDESINWRNVPADPLWTQKCNTTTSLAGTFGKLCVEQSLTATAFYFQLYNWTVFRDTLYFIAMCGTVLTLILIYIFHRQRNPSPFGGGANQSMMMQNGGMGANRSGMMGSPGGGMNTTMPQYGNNNNNGGFTGMFTEQPIQFAGTSFYTLFRFAWGCVSVIIFLWVATQMYSFWRVIGDYKDMTTNELHDFWVDYEKKFVGTVVCITIFLCWPLFHLGLELCLFIVGIIPWYAYRNMCKPGLENYRYTIDTPLDAIPGWVRIDMFFADFLQLQRLGFSVEMWKMLTGSHTPFFESCCENTNAMLVVLPNPADGGESGQGQGHGTSSSTSMAGMMGNSQQKAAGMGMGMGMMQNNNGPQQMNAATPRNGAMLMNGSMLNGNNNNNAFDQSGALPSPSNNDNNISPTKSSRKDKAERSESRRDKRDKSKDKGDGAEGRSSSNRKSRSSSNGDAFNASTNNGGNFSPSEGEGNERRRDKSEKKEKKDKGERSASKSKRDKSDKTDKKDKSKSKRDKKDKSGDSGVYPLGE